MYGILSLQFAITFGFVLLTINYTQIQDFMVANRWLLWTSIAIAVVQGITMGCFSTVTKRVPWNYISLFVFTGVTSFATASICTYVDKETVLIALVLTLTVFVGLTLFSFFVRI